MNRLGDLRANGLLCSVNDARELHEGGEGNLAKRHTAVFLILSLQRLGKIFVVLVSHDVEFVDRLIEDANASLIHRQAKTATDLLPLLDRTARLIERANLEDVRVIPPLPQSGMAEDEAERLVDRQEALFLFHDEVVDLVVGLGVTPRVFEYAFLVLRKVAVMQLGDRFLEPRERCVS